MYACMTKVASSSSSTLFFKKKRKQAALSCYSLCVFVCMSRGCYFFFWVMGVEI